MARAAHATAIVFLLMAAGCTREEDYLEVARDQRAAYKELGDILTKVHDQKSMEEAKAALEERGPKYAEIARRARALPKPSPAVQERLQEDAKIMTALIKRLEDQGKRVEALPGGAEFMQQFKSNSRGLMSAVQP